VEDAIQRTLSDAAAFLAANSVPFAVIGGIAVSVRGEPRFTADVDLVVGVEVERGRDAEDARTIVLKQGPRLGWAYVLKTGRSLQDAVDQDLLQQLNALKRHSAPEAD